jgi:prepilin-type N-terminal cleavage/methylation domain
VRRNHLSREKKQIVSCKHRSNACDKIRNNMKTISRQGFTLIELLVVIAIIGLISSVVLSSLNTARLKSRTVRSIQDMRELQKALEFYYDAHGSYPSSLGGSGSWDGLHTCWGDASSDWIPGLVPTYISSLPHSPNNSGACDNNYIYNSNGVDYKLIWHNPEDCDAVQRQYSQLVDPLRTCWAYGFWTPGAVSF